MCPIVYFPNEGTRASNYLVRGSDIADLQVVNSSQPPPPTAAIRNTAPHPAVPYPVAGRPPAPPPAPPAKALVPAASGPPQQQPSTFTDPAILSYGRSPVQTRTNSKPPPEPSTPVKSMLAKAGESLPSNTSPFVGEGGKSSGSQKASAPQDAAQQAPSTRQSITVDTQKLDADGKQEAGQGEAKSKKKTRRGIKKKVENKDQDPPPVMNAEVSRNGNDMNGSVKRGKGWRQTPLLQPSPQTGSSPQSKSSTKKTRKQHGQSAEGKENGWATEDATDIQDMGDFDFEANHKLFDKKQVFDELRQGDTTADEDRLVGHNKANRPGTYGGKNLHPTENVLSPKLGPKYHSNELDSSSDTDTQPDFANGRSSSRVSQSRVPMKKQPSRQNSAAIESKPHPLSASMSSGMNRSATSLHSKPSKTVPSLTTSPMPDRTHSPHSAISANKSHFSSLRTSHTIKPHLVIPPTMSSCPVLLPSALETLEMETVSRYGLTHDAITETAARSIAETAISMFDCTIGSRRGSRANTVRGSVTSSLTMDRTTHPIVVILAGNHAIGARAAAAARHLISRKTKLIVAEAAYESPETQDVHMRTQLAILKRLVKSGAGIKRGLWRKALGHIKNLSAAPTLIIDALLAGSTYDSLLDSSNAQHAVLAQSEAREMIDWANRSRAPVLSIACPSGVSGFDGSATVVEGEPLAVRPDEVLALGAPMQGLLEAMKAGERWDVRVADIGVNIALRSEEAVGFGASWVADVKFVEEEGV